MELRCCWFSHVCVFPTPRAPRPPKKGCQEQAGRSAISSFPRSWSLSPSPKQPHQSPTYLEGGVAGPRQAWGRAGCGTREPPRGGGAATPGSPDRGERAVSGGGPGLSPAARGRRARRAGRRRGAGRGGAPPPAGLAALCSGPVNKVPAARAAARGARRPARLPLPAPAAASDASPAPGAWLRRGPRAVGVPFDRCGGPRRPQVPAVLRFQARSLTPYPSAKRREAWGGTSRSLLWP